jgi:N-acetylmuramoyl-L-alanine amidase
MKYKTLFLVWLVGAAFYLFPLSINIRSFDHPTFTRVVFEGDEGFEYRLKASPTAVEIRLRQKAKIEKDEVLNSVLIDRVAHRWEEGGSVFRVQVKSAFKIKRNFVLERPFRVVVDLEKSPGSAAEEKKTIPANIDPEDKPQEPAKIPTEKKRELIQVICLDPGHGGTDFGAVGRSKLMEKDITLKVAKKLKKIIESKLGFRVVMTRDKDEEVSLNSRVAQANNQKAQLFVSIHVNSSFRKAANGPETYYVSLNATDQDAFQLSQKENSAFKEEINKLASDDELKMILWDMAQNEYIKESARLADFLQYELNILMHTRNRGVKQAPFRVLMRAAMPAVLVEIAFISNSAEEKRLAVDAFLDNVATSLYDGIAKYIYYHNNLYR